MKKSVVIGVGVAVLVVIGSYLYFSGSVPPENDGSDAPLTSDQRRNGVSGTVSDGAAASRSAPSATAATLDPRLERLKISQDNGFIEFVPDSDGRVIKELDKDPTSLGYKKPTREYTYAGNRVIGLTAYEYTSGYTQVARTTVTYKADGSVDQVQESVEYIYPEKNKNPAAAIGRQ